MRRAAIAYPWKVGPKVAWLFAVSLSVSGEPPSFHEHVRPILQKRCVSCHSAGEIGPMPLTTFAEVRPWAAAIREAVKLREMPPWFADPHHGEFANDPRLSNEEIRTIEEWVTGGAREGKASADRRTRVSSSTDLAADLVLPVPSPFRLAAKAVAEYQYVILPLPLGGDRWVKAVEVRPSDRTVVHHAVLYVREKGSDWLKGVRPGAWWTPGPAMRAQTRETTQDILAIYTPGAPAMRCPTGMAKKIPAGSDLVLQVHYTSKEVDAVDRPRIAITFHKGVPSKRILTLQMGRDDLRIPPLEADYRASVSGTAPNDALLISLFPHMHLRGSAFEFDVVGTDGRIETLLRVKPYRFDWQLSYVLKKPRLLAKGTRLRWTGYFDNSRNNPWNPDPTAEVGWGEQSWDEMMIGFFDVALDPDVDKQKFFVR